MKEYLKESALSLVLLFIDLLMILFYVLCRIIFINLWVVFLFILVTIASIACLKEKGNRRKLFVFNLLLCLAADVIFVGYYVCAITGALERLGV